MTKIDETTGLAALPEDMFWRVKESKLDCGNGYKDVGAVKILLMRKYTTEYPEFETSKTFNNNFWQYLLSGGKQYRTVTETVPAKTTEDTYVEIWGDLLKTSEEEKEGWTKYTLNYSYSSRSWAKYYKVMPATAQQLRDESIRLWNIYLGRRNEEALEEDRTREIGKVLGDYPPKSLKDLVDA